MDAGAPYFFAAACHDVLLLWHGVEELNVRRHEGWSLARHNFEPVPASLPVIMDPFHRYYSLYDDSMIEIKDLNGGVLAKFLTAIDRATKFDFVDHQGTILVANQTHMQLFTTSDVHAWLDV